MSTNNDQPSDSPIMKAYKNQEFLNSALARSIRVQCELLETEQRLQKFGIHNTIVMFGSSRIQDPETAEVDLMPREAMAQVNADYIIKPADMAKFINTLANKTNNQ